MQVYTWSDISGLNEKRKLKAFLNGINDQFSIFELRKTRENEVFIGAILKEWQYLEQECNISHYEMVYLSPVLITNLEETLEQIYQEFYQNKPKDYLGDPVSVSHVIGIHQENYNMFYYIDAQEFKEIHDFVPENYLKSIEELEESNLNMIDGIKNNGQSKKIEENKKMTEQNGIGKHYSIRERLEYYKNNPNGISFLEAMKIKEAYVEKE